MRRRPVERRRRERPIAMGDVCRCAPAQQHTLLLACAGDHYCRHRALERHRTVERRTADRVGLERTVDRPDPRHAVGRRGGAQPPVGPLPATHVQPRQARAPSHLICMRPGHVRSLYQRTAHRRRCAGARPHRLPPHRALQRLRRDGSVADRECHRRSARQRPFLYHAAKQEAL